MSQHHDRLYAGYRDSLGEVQSLCWCGKHYVNVRPEDVRAGQTAECGRGCEDRYLERGVTPEVRGGRPRKDRQLPRKWALRGTGG